MEQSYSLIFWKRQMEDTDTRSLAKLVYEILEKLISYHSELYPQYLPARSKRNVNKFILCEEELVTLLDKGLNKERQYSLDLGTTVAFFTSLDEEKSAKILFSIGYDSPLLDNSIVIDFPATMNEFIGKNTLRLYTLFQDIVEIFQPYYAFVANSLNNHIFNHDWIDKPCCVHWMNYFSRETVQLIGEKKFRGLKGITAGGDGIFLLLQNNLFDAADTAALKQQAHITRRLWLYR